MSGKFRRQPCSGMPGIHLSYPEIPQKMPFDLDRLLFQVTGLKSDTITTMTYNIAITKRNMTSDTK